MTEEIKKYPFPEKLLLPYLINKEYIGKRSEEIPCIYVYDYLDERLIKNLLPYYEWIYVASIEFKVLDRYAKSKYDKFVMKDEDKYIIYFDMEYKTMNEYKIINGKTRFWCLLCYNEGIEK